MNTPELREELTHAIWSHMIPKGSGSTNDCVDELMDIVEAAERRRTEEVIEAAHQWFDPSSPEHHMAKIGSRLKKFLVRKFLKNPER